ncbi:MAG: drug/metabolite exporter YedA [Anaerolineae bacterium]|nr:drug/metabolite exporter YedA [Anaerolineae bacterium]
MPETNVAERPLNLRVAAAFAAIYIIWGSTYLAIRLAIDTIPPFLMAGLRFTFAGAVLFTWLRLRGVPRPKLIHWRSTAIIGGLLLLGGNGGVVWAEQRVASGLAALMVGIVPLWMVLLDWLRPGGKRPRGEVLAGVGIGFMGVVLLVGPGSLSSVGGIDPVGAGVLVFATLSWAVGSLYSRQAPLPESSMMSTALEMLCGGLLLTLAGTINGEWGRLNLESISLQSGLALAYLVVFGSWIAFSAYVWLLKVSTPARVATYAYVNPVVAVFLGWAIVAEPLSLRMLFAAVLIVGAVFLITYIRQRTAVATTVQESPSG